jgi:hypothetical protein
MRPVDRHPLFGVSKHFGRSKLLPLDEVTSDLDTAFPEIVEMQSL